MSWSNGIRKLDQNQRAALMRRITRGDRSAVSELAELYEQAGYKSFAQIVRKAETDDICFEALQFQARTW